MQDPGLADHRADRGAGIQQRLDVGIVGRVLVGRAGRAKGGDFGVLPGHLGGALKELDILGVRARPAAFDEGHPQVVQPAGNVQLVVAREGDIFALRAVAQGGIVDLDHDFHLTLFMQHCSCFVIADDLRLPKLKQVTQLVHALQQAGLGKGIDREGERFCRPAGSGSARPGRSSRSACGSAAKSLHELPGESSGSTTTGSRPFLRALLRKISAKEVEITARKPKAGQRPGGMLARGAAAEIVAGQQDLSALALGLVEDEIRVWASHPAGSASRQTGCAQTRFYRSLSRSGPG